jgi:hypothetical protein
MKAQNAPEKSKPPASAKLPAKAKHGGMHPHHAHVAKVDSALHGSDPYKHHK